MTIYLDNAATAFPKPGPVCDAVDRAMRQLTANPGRGSHQLSLEAARLVLESREAVARFIGAGDSSRIVFTSSATEAINLAMFGLLNPGDRVVTTSMEHNAVIRPLRALADRGVEVVKATADKSGFTSLSAIIEACRQKPRMLVMTHCSNVTGTLQNVAEVGPWCRRNGILLLVDAAQSAGLFPIDVEEMCIDLLAASGHKGLMGPPGTGFLYVREKLEVRPLIYGGTGVLSDSDRQPGDLPERLESGTLNTVGLAGLKAAIEFIEKEGPENVRSHERRLLQRLLSGLAEIPGVTLYGPDDVELHGGAVSFTLDTIDSATLGFRLDREYGICCRTGLHCAPEAHRSIGTYPEGTVRVSPGYFNTSEEIDRFLSALREVAS
jgi:cysteine desulfurase family protein